MKKQFNKEDVQMMESKHMKRHSTSVAMREMYIKTHMRYYSIPIRITKIKNSDNIACWRWHGEIGSFIHCWWEGKMVQVLWGKSLEAS